MKKGHIVPKEGRLNMSIARKKAGVIPPSRKGSKMSEDAKRRISESLRKLKRNPEQYKKMAKTISGSNHWKWKGGKALCTICGKKMNTVRGIKCGECRTKFAKSPVLKLLRDSKEYKLWREAVFQRDNWTCVWCYQRGGVLNADHIKPFAHYPELRFAIDNGRTLCHECHKKTPTYGGGSRLSDKKLLEWENVNHLPPFK